MAPSKLLSRTVTTDQVAMPPATEVMALSVSRATVTLKGLDDSALLVITGQLNNGQSQDFSGEIPRRGAVAAL